MVEEFIQNIFFRTAKGFSKTGCEAFRLLKWMVFGRFYENNLVCSNGIFFFALKRGILSNVMCFKIGK